MATKEGNERDDVAEEYESDPEDSPLPAMRRREAASDDEGSEGGDPPARKDPSADRIGRSDGESDGQGGAEVYDDAEEEYDEEYVDDLEEYEELEETFQEEADQVSATVNQSDLNNEGENLDPNEENKEVIEGEGEKKENEPYAVPTVGAFYMHDDRFQENGRGGRRRRMFGGRKIWNPKDERAWLHDRFEDVNLQETYHDDERKSMPRGGRYRGRGRGGGSGRRPARGGGGGGSGGGRGGGYYKGGRGARSYYEETKPIRGRGPRRYQPVTNKSSNHRNPNFTPDNQIQKTHQQASNSTTTVRVKTQSQAQASNPKQQQQSTTVTPLPKKQSAISSSLNSASPPFYPSSSPGPDNKPFPPQSTVQSERGKSVMSSGPVQSRGIFVNSHSAPKPNQTVRVSSSQIPTSVVQHRPVITQAASRVSAVQAPVTVGTGEEAESGSPSNNNNKTRIISITGKGKERGQQIVYGGGAHNVNLTNGPSEQAGFPALLPVMHFSGQHPGMQTVGMVPGYVSNSQNSFSNSEMAWMSVLAGAGALNASYCQPYITLDSAYYSRPSAQSSSLPSREASTTKALDSSKSPQRPEVPAEEIGQRQNKPRRYSEMNFGQ